MSTLDALRELVERGLTELPLAPELSGLEGPIIYALAGGGKRIRPVLCLAAAEAAGAPAAEALPAALALELVHTFSLVHDDLPAMDDDDERRGRPALHRAYDEGVAILAGDALLAEALRLCAGYDDPAVAGELAHATVAMIGGQYLDITHSAVDLESLHRLKTGRLFVAAVTLGTIVAGLDAAEREPWSAFGAELGLLFQVVDDALDGDGYAAERGSDGARALAAEVGARARARLAEIEGETTLLAELVAGLLTRTR